MPCSTKFSITLQTEILSTETSDFIKQIICSGHLIKCSVNVSRTKIILNTGTVSTTTEAFLSRSSLSVIPAVTFCLTFFDMEAQILLGKPKIGSLWFQSSPLVNSAILLLIMVYEGHWNSQLPRKELVNLTMDVTITAA